MRLVNGKRGVIVAAAAAFALAAAGCQSATETSNSTANTNGNSTVNINGSNANVTTSTVQTNTGQTIEAKEPDKYSAKMIVMLAATGGQQPKGQGEIRVARNGADRRYAVTLPIGGEVIFLDKADKRYIIRTQNRDYAELTPELTGVNVDQLRSMTPGQLVAFVTSQKGVERVGEETFNGRPAIKYRATGATQTQTSAGQVKGETYIYVDKETGLPLRIEGFGQTSGNVQGVTGGNVVIETRDLKTDVNPSDFELPQGYKQLSNEEIKAGVAQLAQGLQALMAFINAQAAASTAPTATPTATPGR